MQTTATRNISDHNALHFEIILPNECLIVAEISMTLRFSYVMIDQQELAPACLQFPYINMDD